MRSKAEPNAAKHFVAKLVKSFGPLGDATESLDDFRYKKASSKQEEIVHGIGRSLGTSSMLNALRLETSNSLSSLRHTECACYS